MGPALVALLLAAAPAPVEGPVAVLPFKNLGNDASLDWLRLGMAETLVADLKRARRLQVVERQELERALAELPGSAPVDDASAARVGKVVAAKTVVLGSFQRAGGQVRIAARFVAVETGVITDAAQATGPLATVFDVQDRLVTLLLGAPPSAARRRGRSDKAVRAFELYGRSLSATRDDDRRALLRQSVAADPDFSYAVDDLAALEARLQGYARASAQALAAEEQALLKTIEDGKAPPAQRADAAARLVDGLRAARRYRTLDRLAPRLAEARAPGVAELAALAAFDAAFALHRWDDGLKAGERFLKAFPASPRFRDVEQRMRELVTARKKRAARVAEYQADLAEKRQDCPGAGPLECDYAPCIAARWNGQAGPLMRDGCSAFLRKHAQDAGPEAAEKVAAARYFVALALVELGEWDGAAAALAELEAGAGADAWIEEIADLRATWPAD